MFGLLKDKNPYEQEARTAYASILEAIRRPVFYQEYGVPDTFDGRFDLLMVHVFLIMDALVEQGEEAEGFNQALFDVCFADMDQTLREMGGGDMSVPKHMRRMMKGFNGRMHNYREALADDEAFEQALIRNLYGTIEQPDLVKVGQMKEYIRQCRDDLGAKKDQILVGRVEFLKV